MPQTLAPAPIRSPIVDSRGIVTAPWMQWLRTLYERVGGASAPSNNDISGELPEDSGIEEVKAGLFALADGLNQAPAASFPHADDSLQLLPPAACIAHDEHLETQIRALSEEVAALRAVINDLKQGLTS